MPECLLSSLSRISRDSGKLFRVLEFLLAHNTRMITTNQLLTEREVWFRKGYYVEPDSRNFGKGVDDHRGMGGAYRKTVEAYLLLVTPTSGQGARNSGNRTSANASQEP